MLNLSKFKIILPLQCFFSYGWKKLTCFWSAINIGFSFLIDNIFCISSETIYVSFVDRMCELLLYCNGISFRSKCKYNVTTFNCIPHLINQVLDACRSYMVENCCNFCCRFLHNQNRQDKTASSWLQPILRNDFQGF